MNKKELLKVLNSSKIAVDKNSTTLGSNCYVVRSGIMYNTNERLCVVQPFPENTTFTANAETLLNAVKSIQGEEVDIVVTNKDITVKGGRTRIKISQSEEQISNRINNINAKEPEWKTLPKDFVDWLGFSLVHTNDRKLNGVYLSGEYAYSTDGWQINRILLDSQFDPIWISQKNVTDIVSFGEVEYYTTANAWLYLRKDQSSLSCRKLDHTGYPIPLLEKTINKFDDREVVISGDETISEIYLSVKAAMGLSESGKVSLQVAEGELFIESKCSTGEYSDIIDVDVESMQCYTVFANRFVDVLAKPGIQNIGFACVDGKKSLVASGLHKEVEWTALLSAE